MYSNRKAGDALNILCQEFSVRKKLTSDGSKEQVCKDTILINRSERIHYHIIEPDLHNQNPVEGVIWEVMHKWYRAMV